MPLQEMAELSALSEADEQLISTLPYVIAFPLKRALTEKHAWTRVNLLKDTFLNYLKYLGLLAASEFFHSPLKDKKMVALFQQALAEPSFGSWNQYIRETLKYLNEKQHPFFCADLPKYYEAVETGNKRKLYKGEIEYIDGNGDVQLKKQEATAIGMLINFRNRYLGHGLTLDEKASQQLWDEYFPIFRTLLEQMQFAVHCHMFKHEHGETYRLQSSELAAQEKGTQTPARVWMENPQGESMDILPFFVVPGEVSLSKEDKEQILAYESYTGKTIKFFSPEGTEKQTSGKILEKLNLLLRDKQKEHTYTPEEFTKEIFLARVADENKLILDTLIAEKKVIPGVYVHRLAMELKLREWIGARANIFFIAAEAGSGKTNLLVEMQKQYTERALPSLLIRPGRMEKKTLSEQLAYLLNINPEKELSSYTNFAGTQAEPSIVLIDGLNEAIQAEALWQEILDISKAFTAGSLKFVVTSRASNKADVGRYAMNEPDTQFMYGENKEREQGLGAYVHWLTALNMAEMKSAWENYAQKEKNKYKPQFSFDDLATFDRAIYSQISNPLVLRLFLETYNNKQLPKKGNKYLNIWADWLAKFQEAEQELFRLLATAIWEKGENELLLDDILNDDTLAPYFNDDRINAPYQRLKNNGWISRYVKDLNACVAFTVEGALIYLLGARNQSLSSFTLVHEIQAILDTGTTLQSSAVESFLSQSGLECNLKSVSQLIDFGTKYHQFCIKPLLHFLKTVGPKKTLDNLLVNPSNNDWKIIVALDNQLKKLEMHEIRSDLHRHIIPSVDLKDENQLKLALVIFGITEDDETKKYRNDIDKINYEIINDPEILSALGKFEQNRLNFRKAHSILAKNLEILKFKKDCNPHDLSNAYADLGYLFYEIGNYEEAQVHFDISLYNLKKNRTNNELEISSIQMMCAGALYRLKEFNKSMQLYNDCLSTQLKFLGKKHTLTCTTTHNISVLHLESGNYEIALSISLETLDSRINILGEFDLSVAYSHHNIGKLFFLLKKTNQALFHFNEALKIRNLKLPNNHIKIAHTFKSIADLYFSLSQYDEAIENYENCKSIRIDEFHKNEKFLSSVYEGIGLSHKMKGDYEFAIISFSHANQLNQSENLLNEMTECSNARDKTNKI